MPNLSFGLQVFQCAQGFFRRYFGINAMELIKIDALEFQPA